MNMMKMKSAKVYLLFNLIVRVLSLDTHESIHSNSILVSLLLCWEVSNSSCMTANLLKFESKEIHFVAGKQGLPWDLNSP